MATGPETTQETQMSDAAIREKTGKTWPEWRKVLDAWGAADKPHDAIARYVHEELGVDGWWAQGVTVGYERMIGRREVGQKADGSFAASASKTVAAGIDAHIAAWTDEAARNAWLPPGTLSLRTMQPGKSARFDDVTTGDIVALWFTDKGPGKSSVSLQIEKLPSREAIDERKALWKARLADLAAHLKG
jgi:hypothetical protein